jgi:glycosyltransferase involved in cell wall biosynthesis
MRVLHITPYFPPTWSFGGIPRIVDGLTRAQSELGMEPHVLTTDCYDASRRSGCEPERGHHGVRVYTVENLSNRLAYRQQLFLPMGMAERLDALPDMDIVHLHGHRHLLNNIAVSFAKRRGIPYVLTANGTLRRHERKRQLKWIWDQVVAGHVPGGAKRCIAVSAADIGIHRRAGIPADRIALIPNGLDLAEFHPLPEPGSFRRRTGLPPGKVVVYLGQISPRKGVTHLVQAFHGPVLDEAQLVIAGNDMGAMDEARAAAGGRANIHFAGLLAGRERLELLASADALVYPSTDEIFGLAPFEGLMCGAPAVVGDDCGCGQLIEEAQAGLLVRHGDIRSLQQRMRLLLGDREAAAAMVRRGREYIRKKLAFPRIAELHRELYRGVIEERRQ